MWGVAWSKGQFVVEELVFVTMHCYFGEQMGYSPSSGKRVQRDHAHARVSLYGRQSATGAFVQGEQSYSVWGASVVSIQKSVWFVS